MIMDKRFVILPLLLACLSTACSMNDSSSNSAKKAVSRSTQTAAQSTVQSAAQVTPVALKSVLDDYGAALKQRNAGGAVAMFYPAVFRVVPQDQWTNRLQRSFNSKSSPTITRIAHSPKMPAKKYANGMYTTVPYVMDMVMQVPAKDVAKVREQVSTPEGRARFESSAAGVIRLRVGGVENISFDQNALAFKIRKSGEYVAINENNSGWKLIDASMNASKLQKAQVFPFEIGREVRRITQ